MTEALQKDSTKAPDQRNEASGRKIGGFWLAIPSLLVMLLLVWVDKDTHSLSDFFRWRMLNAFLLYFVPVWMGSAFVLRLLQRYFRPLFAFLSTIFIGIPFVTGVLLAFWFGFMNFWA